MQFYAYVFLAILGLFEWNLITNFSPKQELSKGKEDGALLESKLKVLEEKLLRGTNTDNAILCEKARQQQQELANAEHILQEKKNINEERQRKIAELEVSAQETTLYLVGLIHMHTCTQHEHDTCTPTEHTSHLHT